MEPTETSPDNNYKQKALELVRAACPELTEFDVQESKPCEDCGRFIKYGHPPQLQHWLRLLADKGCRCDTGIDVNSMSVYGGRGGQYSVVFDLISGQPDTEADYQAIVAITTTSRE